MGRKPNFSLILHNSFFVYANSEGSANSQVCLGHNLSHTQQVPNSHVHGCMVTLNFFLFRGFDKFHIPLRNVDGTCIYPSVDGIHVKVSTNYVATIL